MKSKLKENTKKEDAYPYLGFYGDTDGSKIVVLFVSQDTGTCIHSTSKYDYVGHSGGDWTEVDFTRFSGKVVLENDNL